VAGAVEFCCYTCFIAQGYHNLAHAQNVFNCYPEVAETWRNTGEAVAEAVDFALHVLKFREYYHKFDRCEALFYIASWGLLHSLRAIISYRTAVVGTL
jgi:hypothetical protein